MHPCNCLPKETFLVDQQTEQQGSIKAAQQIEQQESTKAAQQKSTDTIAEQNKSVTSKLITEKLEKKETAVPPKETDDVKACLH